MNAPPGVDTDTSGEEFTPPPSPKAESPKAEFSLTSLLPTQRLKKLRKANAKIKTQTPEQACEKDLDPKPERTHTRLTKKRVRIVDNIDEPDNTPITPPPEEFPEDVVEQAIAHLPPIATNDRDPTQVIALLRQMMAKNTLEDDDEAGDEGEAGDEKTEAVDSITAEPPDPIDNTKLTSPDDIQLPTPIGPSFTKRRPGGLDFSSLFETKAKVKPPPSTANLPGAASQTNLSISTGASSSVSLPNHADPPKSAPSWLWTGPQAPTSGPPSQPYPSAPPPAMSPIVPGYPPWLWAGPDQAHGGQQPVAGNPDRGQTHPYTAHPPYGPQAHSALPPFPPYYPHPQSLQPWQPYYPPWTASPQPYPGRIPYDGIVETSPPGAKAEFFAKAPSWQTPDPSCVPAVPKQGEPNSRAKTEKSRPKPEGPRLRPPAVLINRPMQMDAASIAESTIPEQGVHEDKSSKDTASKPLGGHHKGHIKKALRTVGLVPTPENKCKEEEDTHRAARLSSGLTKSPTWTECLLSLATCIHLGEQLLKHMEAKKGDSNKHKGHFYRLLTKVLASLLTQRSVVEDMTKLVGSDHGDEISHFAKEIHTINKFFRSCLHKRTHSKNDTKRLSDLHGQAARSLEAGGLTHLFGQVFTLTDFLTPAVIKTVTGLLREWANDQLTAKSVMKALMSIQHEVAKVHQQQRVNGAVSKDDAGDVWTLLKYVDLLYGLFVSDNDASPAGPHDTVPGAWPSEQGPAHKVTSRSEIAPKTSIGPGHDTPASKHHHGVLGTSRSNGKEADNLPSPSHRSPRQIMSDIVHPKRTDPRDAKERVLTASPILTDAKVGSNRDPTIVKQPAKPSKDRKLETLPLADIKVEPYRRSTPSRMPVTPSAASLVPKVRSTTPTTPIVTSPQSSPSQYSQDEDEASSEGTVSSDEDAKSLLAQADSGPRRVAPLNIRKKTNGVEKQEVDRAKQMMSG